jgi:hypothetical protein
MAKVDVSFNFGANVKPKKPKAGGKKRRGRPGAWAAYVGSKRKR